MNSIGYARVSTEDQRLDLQRMALKAAGCKRIFEEKISALANERPSLEGALRSLRRGDIFVVWRLDRLGRSLQELIGILDDLHRRGIEFRSVSDNIDTSTPIGKLVFHIAGAMAEFERTLISERTKAGLEAARVRGKRIGRPPRMSTRQVKRAQGLAKDRKHSRAEIAAQFNIGRTTLWRALK